MKIKDFKIEGTFKDDKNMLEVRTKYEQLLEDQMREMGRVPVINIYPQFYTSYNAENDSYDFTLIMYGVYRGKKKAQEIIGWDSSTNEWH